MPLLDDTEMLQAGGLTHPGCHEEAHLLSAPRTSRRVLLRAAPLSLVILPEASILGARPSVQPFGFLLFKLLRNVRPNLMPHIHIPRNACPNWITHLVGFRQLDHTSGCFQVGFRSISG